jgi:hypothetical protein
MATKTIENKTADYTITTADSGKIFTNEGASGSITLTLPSCSAGLYYGFVPKYSDGTKRLIVALDSNADKMIDNYSISCNGGDRDSIQR